MLLTRPKRRTPAASQRGGCLRPVFPYPNFNYPRIAPTKENIISRFDVRNPSRREKRTDSTRPMAAQGFHPPKVSSWW